MRRLLLAVIAGALVLLGSAAPAQAHAELLGTSPGKGKTVAKPPALVVLQFSEQVLTLGMLVQVTGPSGRVEDGPPRLAGAAVVQKLQAGLPAGDYQVAWRVTSDDGHPVDGTYRFTATGAGAGTSPSAEPSAASTTAVPTPVPSQTTVPPVSPVAGSSGPSTGWTVAGIVIVVSALGAGLFALTRPRRRGTPAGAASTRTTPPEGGPPAPPSE